MVFIGSTVLLSGYQYQKVTEKFINKYLKHLSDDEILNFNQYYMMQVTQMMYQ
jgi:hypothetical protein